jgi:stearoyl-CoA desaturase (Delta-9 desaturase)
MAWVRGLCICLLHVPPLTLLWIPVTRVQWAGFGVGYVIVAFALGGALHRYFAHRAFQTSRLFQFVLGLLAAACFADPIGFAGRHRLHHRWSDTNRDLVGPRHGLWSAWIGHLLSDRYSERDLITVTRDLRRYPEIRWLHEWSFAAGVLAIALVWFVGGWTVLAAGYCLPWCLLAVHGTSAVNYVCHRFGARRYATGDHSTNHALLGLVLLGEGWHNNHHRFPRAARSGFRRWELDFLYYIIRLLAVMGLVWALREVPPHRQHPTPTARCGRGGALLWYGRSLPRA